MVKVLLRIGVVKTALSRPSLIYFLRCTRTQESGGSYPSHSAAALVSLVTSRIETPHWKKHLTN